MSTNLEEKIEVNVDDKKELEEAVEYLRKNPSVSRYGTKVNSARYAAIAGRPTFEGNTRDAVKERYKKLTEAGIKYPCINIVGLAPDNTTKADCVAYLHTLLEQHGYVVIADTTLTGFYQLRHPVTIMEIIAENKPK